MARPTQDGQRVQRQPDPSAGSGPPPHRDAGDPGSGDPFGLHLQPGPVQRAVSMATEASDEDVHAAAQRGTSGLGGALPYADEIQRSFGKHDVSGVRSFTGAAADEATAAMGAKAFASGNQVAFAHGAADLHTAAHEAAHVVQQRAGVQLKNDVGEVGDRYEQNADAVADRVVQGASAEDLLDAVAPSAEAGNREAVQRSIGCHQAGGVEQFQIDAARPGWEAHAAGIALAANEARCHVIAFEVIQNDLCNILNVMLANRGTPAFDPAPLNAQCAALFVTAGAPMAAMNVNRLALIAALTALPAAPLTAPQCANLTALSGALLSNLNSCPDNLRAGDAAANGSIGYSVDADFLPGTVWYHGPIMAAAAAPAVGVPPAGAVVAGPGPGPGAVGPFEAVRLTPAHEAKVYSYQGASTLELSFVVSGGGGALFPGTVAGQQLSSTQMPTVAGHPVIVMGGGPPLVFA